MALYRRFGSLLLAAALAGCAARGADETLVCGFETDADVAAWSINSGGARLVTEGVTQGARALELTFDPAGQYDAAHLFWNRVVRDWTPYDALVLDVFNPLDRPIAGSLLIADAAWEQANRSYWNRHNSDLTFAPGRGRWIIPVRGLFRGEAGSRNNDIKRDIDPNQIVRLDFGFGRRGDTGRVIVDNLRFVRVDRPAGVRAFDFGPPSQPVMLGWTAVSHESGYDAARGFGWFPANNRPWNGAARDTTFGTMLTQDFCEAGGYQFRVDVPAGRYRCLVIYENCGYWGGEQAKQRVRRILVGDAEVYREQRPDGASTALWRFEDVEPIGVDIWDTYMAAEIARPVRFEAQAGNDGLVLRFDDDGDWGSRLSALAVWRTDDGAAGRWIDGQLAALAEEFRSKAVCLDPKPAPALGGLARDAASIWQLNLDDEFTPAALPPRDAAEPPTLTAEAVRGEYEPLCLAIRPTRDLGRCRLELVPGEGWPASTVSVVRYGLSRGFGSLAWRTVPHTLRPASEVELPADVTREIIVTANVPADAAPGARTAALRVIGPDGRDVLSVPLRLTVLDLVLDRTTDYQMGFFGLEPPDSLMPPGTANAALVETLRLLREHGMNGVSGGPNLRLTGWRDGRPQIDFAACDAFFETLEQAGFTGPVNGYGGLRFAGLHDGYQHGETAQRVAQQSGLPFDEALRRAWQAVDAHARERGWPTIFYAMCDETRVRETAERELAFMQAMAKVSAEFPRTVQTSGSYSVGFRTRPTDPEDLATWHQRFFGALDISSLNLHDETVMAEAARLGKQIHIYNQGTSRYSFGLYQWSEAQKGVRARWQWHLNVLHGYQFFDLDGREPDTSMIVYGRNGIYPTLDFERCREGAEEFYLLNTLARLAAASQKPGAAAARDWLDALAAGIAIGQRNPPAGYDPAAIKRRAVELAAVL